MSTIDLSELFGADAPMDGSQILGLGLDGTGRRMVVRVDRSLHEFDLRDGSRLHEYALGEVPFDPGEGFCAAMRYTPDGRTLAAVYTRTSGNAKKTFARLFDADSGSALAGFTVLHAIKHVALDPSGALVVFAGPSGLFVHRVADGARVAHAAEWADAAIAWEPGSGALVTLRGDVMQRHDPRTLDVLSRFELPARRAAEFQYGGALYVRARRDLAPEPVQLPLATIDTPWETRAWSDVPYALRWLADDCASAILRTEAGLERVFAEGARVLLANASIEGHRWLEVAVSDDGAVVAWVADSCVHWARITDGR